MGKIGNFELSRLVMGGNLIGGWSHARDLIYVDQLIKTYHSDERVMMTFQLAEKMRHQCDHLQPATGPDHKQIQA